MEDILQKFNEINDVLKSEVSDICRRAFDRSLIERFTNAYNQLDKHGSLEEMDSLCKDVYSKVEKIQEGPKIKVKEECEAEVESESESTRRPTRKAFQRATEKTKEHLMVSRNIKMRQHGGSVVIGNENMKNSIKSDSEIMPAPKTVKKSTRKKKTHILDVWEKNMQPTSGPIEVEIIEQKLNVIDLNDEISPKVDSESVLIKNEMDAVQPHDKNIQVKVDSSHQENLAPDFCLSVIQEEETINVTETKNIESNTEGKVLNNSSHDIKNNKVEVSKKANLRKGKASNSENMIQDEKHETDHTCETQNKNAEPMSPTTEINTNLKIAVNETFCKHPCVDQTVILSKPETAKKDIICRFSNLDIDNEKAKVLDETRVITKAQINETIILSKLKSSNAVCVDDDETDHSNLMNTTKVLDATRIINKTALGQTDVINHKKSPIKPNAVPNKEAAPSKKVAALENEKKTPAIAKTKPLFSPYAKNTLMKKVEKLAEGSGGGSKPTRVTPASSRTLKPPAILPSANKLKKTPENSNLLPSSISSEKTTKILGNYKPTGHVRKDKEEQAVKKREALLQKQTEEKRRQRELREQKAKKAREAQEKIKQEALEVQRRKIEEQAQRFAQRQEQLAKQLELKEQQRQLAKQRHEELQNKKPIYLTEKPPFLPTVDCYDTDDEDKPQVKGSDLPQWNRKGNLDIHLRRARYIDSQLINSLFSTKAQTPNLQELMPSVTEDKLRRKSSAIWKKAPRFTMIQPFEEQF